MLVLCLHLPIPQDDGGAGTDVPCHYNHYYLLGLNWYCVLPSFPVCCLLLVVWHAPAMSFPYYCGGCLTIPEEGLVHPNFYSCVHTPSCMPVVIW